MGDEDCRKLFVGGTRNADEGLLQDYFQTFGEIESVKVIYDRDTNRFVVSWYMLIKKEQVPIGENEASPSIELTNM